MHFGSIMAAPPPPPQSFPNPRGPPAGDPGGHHHQMGGVHPTSPSGMPPRTKVAPVSRDQWYKTKMCPHWPKGTCLRQEACCYAHSESELREPPRLWKTKICQAWTAGACPNPQEQCKFAHGEPDLWCTPDYFKTDICKYWRHGRCTAGELCRHAHGHSELRPRNYRLTELERRIERLRRQGSSKGSESLFASKVSSNDSIRSTASSSAVTSTPVALATSGPSAPPAPIYSSGTGAGTAATSGLIGGVSPTTPPYPMLVEPFVPSYPQEGQLPQDGAMVKVEENSGGLAASCVAVSERSSSVTCSTTDSASSASSSSSAPSSATEAVPQGAPFFSIRTPPQLPPLQFTPTPQATLNTQEQSPQTPTSAAISSFAALSASMPHIPFSSTASSDPSSIGTPPTPFTALVQSELFKAWMPLLPPAAVQGSIDPSHAHQAAMAGGALPPGTMALHPGAAHAFAPGHMTPLRLTPIISGPATPMHGAATPVGGGPSSPHPPPTFTFLYSATPVDPNAAAAAGGTTPVTGPAGCPLTASPVLGPTIFAPPPTGYTQIVSGTATPVAQHGAATPVAPPSPQMQPISFLAGPTTAATTATVSPTAMTTTTASGSPSPHPPLTFPYGGGTTPILGPAATTLPPSPVLAPAATSAAVQQPATAVCPQAVPPTTGVSVTRVGSGGQVGGALGMATSFKAIGSSLSNVPRLLMGTAFEQPKQPTTPRGNSEPSFSSS